MPAINISGKGGGATPPGGGGPGKSALAEAFQTLLNNPSPATEQMFLNLWRARMPGTRSPVDRATPRKDVPMAPWMKRIPASVLRYPYERAPVGGSASSYTPLASSLRDIRNVDRALKAIEKNTAETTRIEKRRVHAEEIAWRASAAASKAGFRLGMAPGSVGGPFTPIPLGHPAAAGGGSSGGGGGGMFGGLFGGRFGGGGPVSGMLGRFGKIGALVGLLADLPFLPGQLLRGSLDLANPYMDLKKGAYGIAGAGGLSGDNAFRSLFPGAGNTRSVDWMSSRLLTPESIMKMMSNFGIVPQREGDLGGFARTFGGQGLVPGFRGMGEGTVEGIANRAVGYGLVPNTPEGAGKFLSGIASLMEGAISRGMDRAKVLSSIEGSIDFLARRGQAAISTPDLIDLVGRMAASGAPGGRTGELAANAVQGMSGVLSNLTGNTPALFSLYSQLPKFNFLKSEGDLARFLGVKQLPQDQMTQNQVGDVLGAARSGNYAMALQLLGQTGLLSPGGTRFSELVGSSPMMSSNVPSYARRAALGTATGMGIPEAYALDAGRSGLGLMPPRTSAQVDANLQSPSVAGLRDIGTAQSLAAQAQLTQAAAAMNTLVPATQAATQGMNALTRVVDKLANHIDDLNDKIDLGMYPGSLPSRRPVLPPFVDHKTQ